MIFSIRLLLPQPTLVMTNARDDFYIRLHREMARTSFVERVNIPRISFRIEPPSDNDRREARSTLRLSQWCESHILHDHVHRYTCCCGMHVCVCMYIIYALRREEREHMHIHTHSGPQLSMPRANIYAVSINQFGCLW